MMSGTLQERHAGNAGDQLKHALLAETWQRLRSEPCPWAYAETHAGAGRYASAHAERVRAALLETSSGTMSRADPAASYARSLRRWWSPHRSDRSGTYPGSPVLALLSASFSSLVLCEVHSESASRLRRSLAEVGTGEPGEGRTPIRVHNASFEQRIDRLLPEPGALFLLVDPYYYDPAASDGAGGRIGRCHLAAFAARLEHRDALLGVFASRPPRGVAAESAALSGQQEASAGNTLQQDLRALAPTAALRCFRAAGTPHAVVLAGWGRGADLVAALPAAPAWSRSWLARSVLALDVREEPA